MFGVSPDLPPFPWSTPPARRRPRPQLDRASLVAAAMVVLDRDGAGGLTMRRVAAELDVSAAALYGHVANKEELIYLVLDQVFAEVPVPVPSTEPWQEQLKDFARLSLEAFRRHPGSAGFNFGRIPLGPSFVERVEPLLDILNGAGIPEQMVAYAGDLFGLYVGAVAYEEEVSTVGDPSPEMREKLQEWFASLPAEQFPNLMSMAGPLARGSVAERFEWGLDVLIRGLASFSQS